MLLKKGIWINMLCFIGVFFMISGVLYTSGPLEEKLESSLLEKDMVIKNASEWTPGLDFIVYTDWEDYYDFDYLNGRFYMFDVIVNDVAGVDLLAEDDIYFWVGPADNREGSEIMDKIQGGSSYSVISTWLTPGVYAGDTEVAFWGSGWWEFMLDSDIIDDYIGERIAFDCVAIDDSTGDVERFSDEVAWHMLSVVGPSVVLEDPDPAQVMASSTVVVDWHHPWDYQEYFTRLDGFEVWLDSGSHITRSSDPSDWDYTFTGVSDGSHTAYVRSMSNSAFGETMSVTFSVDTIGPVPPSLSSPINGFETSDTTPSLQWNAVGDATNYRIQLDDNTGFSSPVSYETTGFSYSWPSLGEGTYYWQVQAQDTAGNWGAFSSYRSIIIDTTGPSPPILSLPTDDEWISENFYTFEWGSIGDAELYQLLITGPTNIDITQIENSYAATGLADGSYTWQVRSIDEAGNEGAYSTPRSFTVDTVDPAAPSLSLPINTAWITENFYTFQWGIIGDAVSYQIYISGPTNIDTTTASTSYGATGLADGSYTWQVRAIDEAGNEGPYSAPWSFIIDTVHPDPPSLSLPSDSAILTESYFTFQWVNVGDAVLYQIQINGPTNIDTTTGSTSYGATGLDEGSYTWQVRSQDAAGNWGIWSSLWSFTVETFTNNPPILSNAGISPGTGDTNTFFTFSVTYTDAEGDVPNYIYVNIDGTDYTMSLSSGTHATGAIYTYSTTLSEGTLVYYFTASDGEYSDTSASDSVSVSAAPVPNTAPTLSSPTASPVTGNTDTIFTFSVIYTDVEGDVPSYLWLFLDGEQHLMAYSSGDYDSGAFYTYGTLLSAGNHTYYFTTSDGEFSLESEHSTFWVDSVGPGESTITLLSPVDNAYFTELFDLPTVFETAGEEFVQFWYALDESDDWHEIEVNGTFHAEDEGLHSIVIRGITISGATILSNQGSFIVEIIPDANASVEIIISTTADERFLEGDYVQITITIKNTGSLSFGKFQVFPDLTSIDEYELYNPEEIIIENLLVGDEEIITFLVLILESVDYLTIKGEIRSSLGKYPYEYDVYPGEDVTETIGPDAFDNISAFSEWGLIGMMFMVSALIFKRNKQVLCSSKTR